MGTRSAVGVTNEDGTYRGRYVHWDGYPSGVGSALLALIERDGAQKVVQTIVLDNYGWSHLNLGQGAEIESLGYQDGRFKAVEGYGIAYTTAEGQSTPNDWIKKLGDGGTEYIYLIEEDGTVKIDSGRGWQTLRTDDA